GKKTRHGAAAASTGGTAAGGVAGQDNACAARRTAITRISLSRFWFAGLTGRTVGGWQPDGPADRWQPVDSGPHRALDVRIVVQAAPDLTARLRARRAGYDRPLPAPTTDAEGEAALRPLCTVK